MDEKTISAEETPPGCCHGLGICVCTEKPDAHHCWVNLRTFLKQIFWKRKKIASVPRQLLQKYLVFVEFIGHWPPEVNQSVGVGQGEEWENLYEMEVQHEETDASHQRPVAELYFHIGRMNFKTWHGSMIQMERAEDYETEPGVLHLQPKEQSDDGPPVFTDLQMFGNVFPLALQWRMRFLTLSADPKHWSLEQDGTVAVVEIPDASEFMVWQGSENEYKRRKAELAARREAAERKRRPRTKGDKKHTKKKVKKSKKDVMKTNKRFGAKLKRKPLQTSKDHADDLEGQAEPIRAIPYEASDDENDVAEEDNSDIDNQNEGHTEQDPGDQDRSPTVSDVESVLDLDDLSHEFSSDKVGDREPSVVIPEPAPQTVPEDVAQEHAPPPPIPETHRPRKTGGTRSSEDVYTLQVRHFGEIRYNERAKTMQAVCRNPGHEDCRKTKTTDPKSKNSSGRPLGFLIAWLEDCFGWDTKLNHVHSCKPSLESRQKAREWFERNSTNPDFGTFEKARRPNEPSEPTKV